VYQLSNVFADCGAYRVLDQRIEFSLGLFGHSDVALNCFGHCFLLAGYDATGGADLYLAD
jgi:hypothetical protein